MSSDVLADEEGIKVLRSMTRPHDADLARRLGQVIAFAEAITALGFTVAITDGVDPGFNLTMWPRRD